MFPTFFETFECIENSELSKHVDVCMVMNEGQQLLHMRFGLMQPDAEHDADIIVLPVAREPDSKSGSWIQVCSGHYEQRFTRKLVHGNDHQLQRAVLPIPKGEYEKVFMLILVRHNGHVYIDCKMIVDLCGEKGAS